MCDDLEAVVARFTAWHQPWEFHHFVLSALSSPGDRDAFEAAWNDAVDPRHWTATRVSTAEVAASVRDQFPWLGPAAAEAIVRAASYEWR